MYAELLNEVRELISDPTRWTKGSWARKADGEACTFEDPAAVAFDIMGAVGYVFTKHKLEQSQKCKMGQYVRDVVERRTVGDRVIYTPGEVNEVLGHQAALDLLTKAIEKAMSEG